ncbi:MAG: glycosyltransferase family 2 protein [Candidatus Hodarchaeota archaeon]
MKNYNKILVIIPAYNEEKNISQVINKLRKDATFVDYILVNDASTDNTAEVARNMRVPVISLPINLGIGGAVQTGFKYAIENDYDIAIQVDGDGQHDTSQIPKLIKPIEEGSADIVIGSRYIKNSGYKTPIMRRIGIAFFSWLTSIICHQRITDSTSGFRALNKKAVDFFAREYPVDFPDTESLILLHRAGFTIKEIPVTMNQRLRGASSINLFKSIYYPYKSLLGILVGLLRKK